MNNIGLAQGKITVPESKTLEEFLKLPYIEESPVWEYINGEAIQKPMGGGKHSLLQKHLVAVCCQVISKGTVESLSVRSDHIAPFLIPYVCH